MNVLVVNAGSSSLKLDLLDERDERIATQHIDGSPASPEARDALADFLQGARDIEAVGHRLVHGGPDITRPTVIDDALRRRLDAVAQLAPMHVPAALNAIDLARARLPGVPHVACVDTAFHADMPEPARTYALPEDWRRRFGLRRYGFHGLSYAWALRRTAELLGREPDQLHVVLAHLGGGASVCAVRDGRSVWTSMGFTPLEGLVMVKRSGSVDPGMLLWLQTTHGLSAQEISDALQYRAGLLGLSGGRSGDTRELVAAAQSGDQTAELAMAVYTLRVRQEIAAAAVSLDRLDALVFTGEIGADQPEVRQAVCDGLAVIGLGGTLDARQDADRMLARSDADVAVLLVHPREDRQIATEVRRTVIGTTARQR